MLLYLSHDSDRINYGNTDLISVSPGQIGTGEDN